MFYLFVRFSDHSVFGCREFLQLNPVSLHCVCELALLCSLALNDLKIHCVYFLHQSVNQSVIQGTLVHFIRVGVSEQNLGTGCAHYFWGVIDFRSPQLRDGEGSGTPLQYTCLENPMDGGAWWAAVHGVARSQTRLSDFTFSFHFHALEKEMATHSSVLAWRIPGTGEPGGLLSMGSHRVGHD